MKNLYLSFCVVVMVLAVQSCETPDDSESNGQTEILEIGSIENLKVIPYEIFEIPVNNPPGVVGDYKLYFGATKVIVSEILSDGIEIVIPRDIAVGSTDAVLNYKEQEYPLGRVEVLNYNNYFPANLGYIFPENGEYPIIMVDSAQTVITPHVVEGKVDNISFQFKNGTSSHLELNELGLPKQFYSEKLKVIYDNYDFQNKTVNIAYYVDDDIENAEFEYAVTLNQEALELLEQSRNQSRSQSSISNMLANSISASISLAACAASIATAPTGIGLALVMISCSSATYDAMKLIDPGLSNEVANKMQAFVGLEMDAIDCLTLPVHGMPTHALEFYGALNGCINTIIAGVQGIGETYDYYNAERERILQSYRSMLNSGYGDIKITLSWDTETDIDLWVTDPFSEKIWYDSPFSSSGGELDVDNVEGYGPENVFWPTNEAPFGTYTVQIHYYGPEDGPVTNCKVVIDNFGVQTTYHQALTPDGLATIAIFEAGARGMLIQSGEISLVTSSGLPSKN
ncbi:hypothetical protein [Gramella sp. AN32]|uniref:YfaP family protein n=1 Tax=Christiangramia antarctica TaxID=2058158 RepID=A0ABW5X9B6_9FLAO|nr:hypothetical protein [Gramella sp. AN32]MCM4157342.1 hypothetical protein [Gramella sp. AN32]